MVYGILLFDNRVSPSCKITDNIMIIRVSRNDITIINNVSTNEPTWPLILHNLNENRVDLLVCGGINNNDKKAAIARGITVFDNVACDSEELLNAIETKTLRPGFGFLSNSGKIDIPSIKVNNPDKDIDCINCSGKECLSGEPCPFFGNFDIGRYNNSQKKKLDAAMDINMEDERILCRLSELIYYALDMKYKRIGIAYCTDLQEATEILVSVLNRFFKVIPICCKIEGTLIETGNRKQTTKIACNPVAQADILNIMKTDLNVIVGLSIGADTIFTDISKAPVTTLFVKDKSLANNPIGALYSDYYLKEASNSSFE